MKVLIEKCRKFLNNDGFSDILMTDLPKAFYCNNHESLIAKVHANGLDIAF